MPFKSKAQSRLFFEKEKKGELPPGTAAKWQAETPNFAKLPERKKKPTSIQEIKVIGERKKRR